MIRKLEMVQHRAARMVFSDYRLTSSVSPMLQHLQWPTLQERRTQAKIYMMYRIVYNLVDIPVSYLTATILVRGHNMRFLVPYARTAYQRSFFLETNRIWNSLPQPVVSCPALDSFRGRYRASDYVRLVLDDFNCTVNRCFSCHLHVAYSWFTYAPVCKVGKKVGNTHISGKYSYFPGWQEILVTPGKYW